MDLISESKGWSVKIESEVQSVLTIWVLWLFGLDYLTFFLFRTEFPTHPASQEDHLDD